jgi:phosphate transport system substrate-binding protein
MNANQTQVCRKCGYGANTNTDTHCQNCNYPLNIGNVSTTKSSAIAWSAFPIIGLLLLTLGLYFLWRNHAIPTTADNPSSTVATTPRQSQPVSAKFSPASDLQLYNSMRDVPNVPKGLFNYGGAICFAAMTAHGMNSAITKAQPQFHLRYTEPLNAPPGCSTGIKMLLNSELSFAQNGRPLEDAEYTKARERNFKLQQVPVAIDGLVFFTHKNVPVTGLTINQLQDIFLGKVTNWKQVGGPDLPLVPISLDPKVHITLNLLLGNQGNNIGRNVKIVRDYTTAIRKVASTPGGISYSSASTAIAQQTIHPLSVSKAGSNHYVPPFTQSGQVNVAAFRDDTYPLTRRLFVVIRRDGTPDEQAGVAYANLLLSGECQQIIEKAGFAAIH